MTESNRVTFRVTAFGDEKWQEHMHGAIAMIKGVELVEVESVEEPKGKAAPAKDPSEPKVKP